MTAVAPSTELIAVDLIDPNPEQPRSEFNAEALQELADSIAEHGLIQPVVVSRLDDRYILTAGERRLRASKLAGLTAIPAHIEGDFDITASGRASRRQRAVVENLQRQDMNVIEIALSLQEMKDDDGLTDEAIAKKIGKGRAWVANKRALLNLPQMILDRVGDAPGQISERVAMRLIPATKIKPHEMEFADLTHQTDFTTHGYGDPPTPNALFRRVAERNDLTSDQVDEVIKRIRERIEQSQRRETRYCRFCHEARQFTGRELNAAATALSPTCAACGNQMLVSRWLTALEVAEAQARAETPAPPPAPTVLASAPAAAAPEIDDDDYPEDTDGYDDEEDADEDDGEACSVPALTNLADRVKAEAAARAEAARPLAQEIAGAMAGLKTNGNGKTAAPADTLYASLNIRFNVANGVARYTLSFAKDGQFPAMRSGVALELPSMVQRYINELTPSAETVQEN